MLENCCWKHCFVPRRLTLNWFNLCHPFQIYHNYPRTGSLCSSLIPAPPGCLIHNELEERTIQTCCEVLAVSILSIASEQVKIKPVISFKFLLCLRQKCHRLCCVQKSLLKESVTGKQGGLCQKWWVGTIHGGKGSLLMQWATSCPPNSVSSSIEVNGNYIYLNQWNYLHQ